LSCWHPSRKTFSRPLGHVCSGMALSSALSKCSEATFTDWCFFHLPAISAAFLRNSQTHQRHWFTHCLAHPPATTNNRTGPDLKFCCYVKPSGHPPRSCPQVPRGDRPRGPGRVPHPPAPREGRAVPRELGPLGCKKLSIMLTVRSVTPSLRYFVYRFD